MQTTLHKAIMKAAKSSGKEEVRYYLKGVYLEQQENSLIIVGTDGHRLTRVILDNKGAPANMILSTKGVKALPKDVTVLDFNSPDKVDGTYPQYERAIPDKQSTPTYTFNRKDLIAKIKSLMPAGCKKKSQYIVFDLGMIVNRDNSNFTNKATAFNAVYLLDMLATMDGKTVEIHQADKTSPALFLDPSDVTFTGVIMPIRV